MKKFILKTILFLCVASIFPLAIFSIFDVTTDPYWRRFMSPKQSSLILGISRSALGLRPAVINRSIDRNDLYNYSFTIGTSPYGPVYLTSIKRKLKNGAKNGVFILAVDPWSISSKPGDGDPNDKTHFRENKQLLATISMPNNRTKLEFMIRHYSESYLRIIKDRHKSYKNKWHLHSDGWLELSLPMDVELINERKKKTMRLYREEYLPQYKYSTLRYGNLAQTIQYLRKHGKVYLVRLPLERQILEVDSEFMPNFESLMCELSEKMNVPYLSLAKDSESFSYIDGTHLSKDSAVEVSKLVGDWISSIE